MLLIWIRIRSDQVFFGSPGSGKKSDPDPSSTKRPRVRKNWTKSATLVPDPASGPDRGGLTDLYVLLQGCERVEQDGAGAGAGPTATAPDGEGEGG